MKTLLKYVLTIFLTIITCGIYGAYLIVNGMSEEPNAPSMTEEERAARRDQNNRSVVGLQYFLGRK